MLYLRLSSSCSTLYDSILHYTSKHWGVTLESLEDANNLFRVNVPEALKHHFQRGLPSGASLVEHRERVLKS